MFRGIKRSYINLDEKFLANAATVQLQKLVIDRNSLFHMNAGNLQSKDVLTDQKQSKCKKDCSHKSPRNDNFTRISRSRLRLQTPGGPPRRPWQPPSHRPLP